MSAVRCFLLVALLALSLTACNMKKGAGDGDLGNCQPAVDHITEDCGIEFDGSSGSCTQTDECIAVCIEDASCEVLSGQDESGLQVFNSCVAACQGVANTTGCRPCGDYLDGLAAYEELCPDAQQLLDGWAACLCEDACASPCYDSACMGVEASAICGQCVLEACAEPTDACRADR